MLKVRNTSRLVFKKGKLCDKNTNLEKKAKLSESLILLTKTHTATSGQPIKLSYQASEEVEIEK